MTDTPPWAPIASRVAASLLGSYAFVWGFTTLIIAVGLVSGAEYEEARTLAYLLAFLAFLGAFLWSFAAARLTRLWLVLVGGGATMTGTAWLLTHSLT